MVLNKEKLANCFYENQVEQNMTIW